MLRRRSNVDDGAMLAGLISLSLGWPLASLGYNVTLLQLLGP